MVDEPSPSSKAEPLPPTSPPAYGGLRMAVRVTGLLFMLAGVIYLGRVASSLLIGNQTGVGLFEIVVSLVGLGLGIYVLRIGFNMLRSVNIRTIGSFSFAFALIYTFILLHILPSNALLNDYPAVGYLLVFLYFGLSYWIVKTILVHLLLPRAKSS